MASLRRLLITGLVQLAAFLALLYYAVVFVTAYYLRLALVTAALVDAATSVWYLLSALSKGGEASSE